MKFTIKEIETAITTIFMKYDINGDGVLSREEMSVLVKEASIQLGIEPLTSLEMEDFFTRIDQNKDNRIDPNELKLYFIEYAETIPEN